MFNVPLPTVCLLTYLRMYDCMYVKPWDPRYGEGSSPSINAIVTMLHTCGLNMFWQYSAGGWPSNQKIFVDMDMKDVRYNLASFIREH